LIAKSFTDADSGFVATGPCFVIRALRAADAVQVAQTDAQIICQIRQLGLGSYISPTTQYVIFRASSMPLIKAYPKGTSVAHGSQRRVIPLSKAVTLSKGMLEAPNVMNLKGQAEACLPADWVSKTDCRRATVAF
jgi:hypothetical protein